MAVIGSPVPRVFTPPLRELVDGPEGVRTSWGFDVVWFAREILGEPLTPWQEWLAIHSLELLPPERVKALYPTSPELWSAEVPRFKTVLVLVARQNGKTHWAKVLIKWALFRKRLPYILGAAQTKNDAFELWEQITDESETHPKLKKRLRRTSKAHGFEALRSKTGQYRIAGLDRKDGRGKTVNLLYLDELREHKSWDAWKGLTPTTKSPLIGINVCTTNAGDMRSVVLNSLQDKATDAIDAGETASVTVGLFEWSARPDRSIDDRDGWAEANPDLGHGRMNERDIAADLEAMDPDGFRTEVLCQRVESLEQGKIKPEVWEGIADPDSVRSKNSPIAVGIDVATATDGSTGRAYIYGAAFRDDGRVHVEHLETFDSYYMVPGWLEAQRTTGWFDGRVGLQITGSPSAHLGKLLEETEIEVVPWNGVDMSSSCLGYFASIHEDRVRWRGPDADHLLHISGLGVRDQSRADTWIWSRTKSLDDASPFIATNIAWWLLNRVDDSPVSAYSSDDWDDPVADERALTDFDDDDLLIV